MSLQQFALPASDFCSVCRSYPKACWNITGWYNLNHRWEPDHFTFVVCVVLSTVHQKPTYLYSELVNLPYLNPERLKPGDSCCSDDSSALCLPPQAGAGGALPAGRKRRLLHHPPTGSPQSSPGLAGRLDPHQGHAQPPAHPRHWRPAPTKAAMTTAHTLAHTQTLVQ